MQDIAAIFPEERLNFQRFQERFASREGFEIFEVQWMCWPKISKMDLRWTSKQQHLEVTLGFQDFFLEANTILAKSS